MKKSRRLLSLLACLVVLIAMLSVTAFAADDLTVTIDTGASVTLKDTDGDGYYEIGTADELYAFAAAVNGGSKAINAELTENIAVNEGTMTESSTAARVWDPITGYGGTFDGCNHTISGLYCNSSLNYIGFFAGINTGTVKNVGIINSFFQGNSYVGAVAAFVNKGSIINCYSNSTVKGTGNEIGGLIGYTSSNTPKSVIDSCYNEGSVSGGRLVGGVIGNLKEGTATNCYNIGSVNGQNDTIGGVAGYSSYGVLENCYNIGTVSGPENVGGIVGKSDGSKMQTVYNTGNITGAGDSVGGVVGYISSSDIQNGYNTGNVTGDYYVGGIVGYYSNGDIVNCYNTGSLTYTQGGGVIGKIKSQSGSSTISNCYYAVGTANGGIDGKDTSAAKRLDTAAFAGGQVAYLLNGSSSNGIWKQTIDVDASPNFTGSTVYAVRNCKNEIDYSNTKENKDHNYVDDVCTVCNQEKPVVILGKGNCGANGDNLTWSLTENGLLTISGNGEMANYSNTAVPPWAAYTDNILKVVVEDGVSNIGENAFKNCNKISTVILPNTVTSISHYAFEGCSSLTTINIPNGVTAINMSTFKDCIALDSIIIPNSVTAISNDAFYGCNSLNSVNIPDSVTTIGNDAFYGCALQSIVIPNSVTYMGLRVFRGCRSLVSVDLPDNITSIMEGTFENCDKLNSIDIPDTVTSIGDNAFSSCSALSSIDIPGGVTSIGNYAFTGCKELTAVELPNSVSSIGNNAFSFCSALETITIPGSVTSIGLAAFQHCNSLTSVVIPESVTSIGMSVFSGCSALADVTILANIPTIKTNFFQGCSSLASVRIPASVTSVEDGAFMLCTKLTDVYYGGTESQWREVSVGTNNDPLSTATVHYSACIYTGKHTFENESCTQCGAAQIKFYGTNMTLGNALDLNFAIKSDLVSNDWYAVITRSYSDDSADVTIEKIYVEDWDSESSPGLHLVTYKGLAAKEMCDTVKVEIFNGKGELLCETSDSIRSYAMRCLENTEGKYTAVEKTLFMEMLNYGAEAQKQFGYNTDNLANAGCEAYAEFDKDYEAITNKSPTIGGQYMGTSLVLNSCIEMQMGFVGSSDGVCASISYTDHYGNAHSYENAKLHPYMDENNAVIAYGVIIPDIVVADARQDVTVTITKEGAEPIVVIDSVAGYVARNNGAGVYKAIMDFSDAARAYFREKGVQE